MARKKKDRNGLLDPLDAGIELTKENAPRSPLEAKEMGINVYYDATRDIFVKMRFKSRAPIKNGMQYESGDWSNYKKMKNRGSRKRRAVEKDKLITVDEREAWYKRNFENIPEGMTARDIALQDQADNAAARAEQAAEAKRQGKAYEHLSPLNAPEQFGGYEDAYNIDAADKSLNGSKSDKVATPSVMREQGVPLSRASAIQKQAKGTPVPKMDGKRFAAVNADIQIKGRPKANDLLKILPKLL